MIERHPITSREQWLELRRQDVTASDVAIVCGEGAWGSLAQLYADKKGLSPPLTDSGVLKRGRWGEAAVFEALADERPEWELRRAKIYLRDSDLRLGCTPDGFALAPGRDGIGIVQAKTVSRSVFYQKWVQGDDEFAIPPRHYMLQTLTEEMLAETTWGVIAVVINGEYDWDFRLFDVERHAEAEARIKTKVVEFWQHYLDPNIMPPFEPQRDAELIKALYPEDTGTTVDLSADNRAAQLVDDLSETQAALKRLGDSEKTIKAELQAKMGENTFGVLADGRCLSWKLMHRRGYTVEPTDYRQFRILKHKPEAG
jgi:predicted phage-related endonuclease